MDKRLKRHFEKVGSLIDGELDRLLSGRRRAAIPFLEPEPETLRKAMRYSLFAGGKRLRPALVLAAAEACGRPAKEAARTACAVEMIHTYSLIHDDLPAMDDDDLRRGKPTSHKVFGEAVAILAGDALLTYAFELAAGNAAQAGLSAAETSELIRVLACGAGARGMVGGQVADLEAEGRAGQAQKAAAKSLLRYIHTHKTAALITASLEAGAILGRAKPFQRAALRAYGRSIGLAFQIADDILDVVGDKTKLGKRGSDEANAKLTYARLYGIEGARAQAEVLARRARVALLPLGPGALVLKELADYVVSRDK